MNTNINLTVAVNQMRQARKAGKISNKVQARTLRRLGLEMNPNTERWAQVMKLRAEIHREIDPKIKTAISYAYAGSDIATELTPKKYVSKRITNKPQLKKFDCTPEWWNLQEYLDRTESKIETLEDKPVLTKGQRRDLAALKAEMEDIKSRIADKSKEYEMALA